MSDCLDRVVRFDTLHGRRHRGQFSCGLCAATVAEGRITDHASWHVKRGEATGERNPFGFVVCPSLWVDVLVTSSGYSTVVTR